MSDVSFRLVNRSDAAEMQFIASIDTQIPALYDSDFLVDEAAVAERLKSLLKDLTEKDFFEVAVCDDKIVGFHAVRKYKYLGRIDAASIYTLWVDPGFRKQGIATRLKARAESWAKALGLDHMSTFVHAKNPRMLEFNQGLGFEVTNFKMMKKL